MDSNLKYAFLNVIFLLFIQTTILNLKLFFQITGKQFSIFLTCMRVSFIFVFKAKSSASLLIQRNIHSSTARNECISQRVGLAERYIYAMVLNVSFQHSMIWFCKDNSLEYNVLLCKKPVKFCTLLCFHLCRVKNECPQK